MNKVDPQHFKTRFLSAVGAVFDAARAQDEANERMSSALSKLHTIAGQSFATAVHELATEPRRVCSSCNDDFMAADTGRDKCRNCIDVDRAFGARQ